MIEMRSPTLSFGPELGWVECELGRTRCVQMIVVDSFLTIACCQSYSSDRRKNDKTATRTTFRGYHIYSLRDLSYGIE
jgi:hypothetical protein